MGVGNRMIAYCLERKGRFLAAGLLAGTALGGVAAYAAGLGIPDQSADTVAHAYGGAGVNADPSIAYYNPAGMVLLKGNQIEQSFDFYRINSQFDGSDTSVAAGTTTGAAKGFVESTLTTGTFNVVSLPDGLKAGLSVTVPIGGRVKYPDNFVGQYEGTEALVTTIQVGLDIAVPITSQLSIGFGPEINWFQNILSESEYSFGFTPTSSGRFSAKGYGVGFNVGLLYQFSPETRFGIDYRSKINQTLKGTEFLSVPNATLNSLLSLTGTPAGSPASDKWVFPQEISFGFFQQVTAKLSVMASALFTDWAQETNLTITDPSTTVFTSGAIYTPFKYRDTWTVGAGANYDLTPKLTLMGGVGYDETPIKKQYRQDLLPDANRTIFGFGLSYQIAPSLKAELAYQHIIFANGSINQTRLGLAPDGTLNDVSAGTLSGQYKLGVNVLSAAVIGKF